MKVLVAFFLSLLILFSSSLEGRGFERIDLAKETEAAAVLEKAISASLKKLLSSGFTIADKKMVVSRYRGYVVVSFILDDENMRGGRVHCVYDPKSNRIVYVLGQD